MPAGSLTLARRQLLGLIVFFGGWWLEDLEAAGGVGGFDVAEEVYGDEEEHEGEEGEEEAGVGVVEEEPGVAAEGDGEEGGEDADADGEGSFHR